MSYCSYKIVNFGLLAAEIVSLVWGIPANFNGFHVLAALLHGTLVVGVSQTLRVEQRASLIFDRAAITLGIGPHSSFLIILFSYGWCRAFQCRLNIYCCVISQMSEDDPTMTAPDPTELPESRDSGLSNQQQRHKVASNNAEYTVEVGR